MKTIILAIILSITFHLLFLYNYKVQKVEKRSNNIEKKQNDKKSSITYVRIKQKKKAVQKSEPKKIVKNLKKVEKPRLLKRPKKLVEVKKTPIIKKKKRVKKAKKIIPLVKKEEKIIKKEFKKIPKEITPAKRRKTIEKKSLENFLAEPDLDTDLLDDLTKSYLKLYGDEYNKFTKVQKAFLKNNLRTIGEVTQRYLIYRGYPKISIQTKQEGVNVIEFYLYPNGDIKGLKITNSSGYTALDKNTIQTVEVAYKDYPRPKEVTKVKIYVFYRLY